MTVGILLVQLPWLLYSGGNGGCRVGLDLVPYVVWGLYSLLWYPRWEEASCLGSLPRCESEEGKRATGLISFLQLISKVDLGPSLQPTPDTGPLEHELFS